MKVLHVTPSYYPATYWGGPIFSVSYLNNALAQLPEMELKVLTTDTAGPKLSDRLSTKDKLTPFPYEVIFARRVAGASVSIDLLRQLPNLIRWADVVHLTATFSFPTIPTLALCRIYGKPVVWSLRGALLDDQNRSSFDPQGTMKQGVKALWLSICGRFVQPGRVSIHVTTGQEREAVARMYPNADYTLVPNGVEVAKALPLRTKGQPNGGLRLMFMGRLAPKKGIENLLRAIAKIDIPVSLDVYGTSTSGQGGQHYGANLIKLAKELNLLDKRVRFRGHVNGETKNRAFLEADICVIPSYSENFCIVVAEALAMGLPVIVSSRLPQWREVVKRNCGLWVNNDPDTLALAIQRIRNMELPAMGNNGWGWMKKEYDWKKIASEMQNVYAGALEVMKHDS